MPCEMELGGECEDFPDCVWNYSAAMNLEKCCGNSSRQFCKEFRDIIPYTYMGFSILSSTCCMLVFITYLSMSRLRQTGYSSKIFLNRTIMDFLIAIGHIVSGAANLPGASDSDPGKQGACAALGAINQFALVASNLWYVFLAVDLIRAIRNPFSSHPSYTWPSNLFILLFSLLWASLLATFTFLKGPGGPGTSMFYWCWIRIERLESMESERVVPSSQEFEAFVGITFALYYLWHIISWVFSLVVTMVAGCILWGHLAASSATRKFVLKQNLVYVLVLGIETFFILTFWLTQIGLTQHHFEESAYFYTYADFILAFFFAVIHSLRGTVDLLVWVLTFSIGPKDFGECFRKYKIRFSRPRDQYIPFHSSISSSLREHLITPNRKDNLINKALRRNAIYCINVGILDAVQLDLENIRKIGRVGSVREPFVAEALMELDEENQRDEVAQLHLNPFYREQVTRKIRFPASSTHLKEFSFIDLEPTVFSLLRQTFGITPRAYRKSFEIKNASDIDSSLMLEKFTEGKSGSFFYFTQDYRFIIKTVTSSEEKFLCKIAYQYYEHMKENKDSLIVRFYGLHKVRLAPEQRFITVVVMENIFYNSDKLTIHRCFDLKGSWVGRRALKAGQKLEDFKGTLKDLDLGEEKIFIGPDKEALMELLRKDVAFLTRCHIMDYSLLLGVHQHIHARGCSEGASSSSTSFSGASLESSQEQSQNGSGGGDYLYQSPDKKSRALGTTGHRDEGRHVPWYRQDSGGLRSPRQSDLELSQRSRATTSRSNRDSMVRVSSPQLTYFFGVVDILQQYTLRKKVEHLWKTRVLRQNRDGLSAVNETQYGQRFLDFLDRIIE